MMGTSLTSYFRRTFSLLQGIVFLLFLMLASNGYSQRETLEGKISTIEDLDIEGINIFNLTTNKGTVSNAEGIFWIAVALQDTLTISALHIQTATIIVGKEQMANKKIPINLSEKMNQLGTVTLRRFLTGYLGSDANIIPTEQPITASFIGLPNADLKQLSKTERELYAANSGPVDALVNMISGRTKMLKKRLEFHRTNELTLSLLDKFPETYFTDGLNIESYKVYSFLYFCENDPQFKEVMKGPSVEIIEFLQRKSKEFRNQ
ncbi:MAG TPA: carboxypeptidase-like regulatory domain-containing protein [Aequorivita sp.]|nr:carboxypeptidase-like regulatory domain-containing protein [Aequorivita sp.]